jgi:hypothetical protein
MFNVNVYELALADNGYWGGSNTPNFHKLKREGVLLPQTHWKKFKVYGTTSGHGYLKLGSVSSYYEYERDATPYTHWLLTEQRLNSLIPTNPSRFITDAAAAIYSSGHDMLTFLAELTSVYRMFRGVVPKLAHIITTNPRRLSLRAYTGLWLEGRYGWRTLMYDLQDLHDAVTSHKDSVQRISKSCGMTYGQSESNAWTESGTYYYTDHIWNDAIKVGVRGNVVADIAVPRFRYDVTITGWELIPFSFVVDWVIGVGRAIAAAAFVRTAVAYAASYGYVIDVTRMYESTRRKKTALAVDFNQTGSSSAQLLVRIPSLVPLIPSPRLRMDAFKVADLLALIIQAVTSRRK